MWRRYILGNPAFVGRAIVDAMPSRSDMARSIDLAAKRALDIVGAGIGLALCLPLFLIVAAGIRLTSPGPAFLKQTRVGKDGKTFSLFKFRSMYVDAEARRAELEARNQHGSDGVTFKMRRDPRITPFGRILRKSSIDELPQLWNILIGDMSLVGPRPPMPKEVERYTPAQWRRLAAKPGLTCLWQISGRNEVSFQDWMKLDLNYIDNWSLLLDLKILLKTVPVVLLGRGAK